MECAEGNGPMISEATLPAFAQIRADSGERTPSSGAGSSTSCNVTRSMKTTAPMVQTRCAADSVRRPFEHARTPAVAAQTALAPTTSGS